jgi:hypothetical protein
MPPMTRVARLVLNVLTALSPLPALRARRAALGEARAPGNKQRLAAVLGGGRRSGRVNMSAGEHDRIPMRPGTLLQSYRAIGVRTCSGSRVWKRFAGRGARSHGAAGRNIKQATW